MELATSANDETKPSSGLKKVTKRGNKLFGMCHSI